MVKVIELGFLEVRMDGSLKRIRLMPQPSWGNIMEKGEYNRKRSSRTSSSGSNPGEWRKKDVVQRIILPERATRSSTRRPWRLNCVMRVWMVEFGPEISVFDLPRLAVFESLLPNGTRHSPMWSTTL